MPLAVDAVHVSGEWIRHAPHRSDLLGRSPEPTDGRWQRGEVVRGLYLADETETAVAEWYRWLAERGLPPTHAIPHDHHVWRLDLEIADLRSARTLASLGLDLPRPGLRTWAPYQRIGETLWQEGWAGLLTRSAARPHALVMCVFENDWPPAGCTPVRRDRDHQRPAPAHRHDDLTWRAPRSVNRQRPSRQARSKLVAWFGRRQAQDFGEPLLRGPIELWSFLDRYLEGATGTHGSGSATMYPWLGRSAGSSPRAPRPPPAKVTSNATPYRMTMVVERRDGRWLVRHAHGSSPH